MKTSKNVNTRKTTRTSTRILCMMAALVMVFSALAVATVPASAGYVKGPSSATRTFTGGSSGLTGYTATRQNVLYVGDKLTVSLKITPQKFLFWTTSKSNIEYTVTYTFNGGDPWVNGKCTVKLNVDLTSGSHSDSDNAKVTPSPSQATKTMTLTCSGKCQYDDSFNLIVTVKEVDCFGR